MRYGYIAIRLFELFHHAYASRFSEIRSNCIIDTHASNRVSNLSTNWKLICKFALIHVCFVHKFNNKRSVTFILTVKPSNFNADSADLFIIVVVQRYYFWKTARTDVDAMKKVCVLSLADLTDRNITKTSVSLKMTIYGKLVAKIFEWLSIQ